MTFNCKYKINLHIYTNIMKHLNLKQTLLKWTPVQVCNCNTTETTSYTDFVQTKYHMGTLNKASGWVRRRSQSKE